MSPDKITSESRPPNAHFCFSAGFVVGAVMQSILNAADLVRPQMLYFMGCVGAAGWNALVAAPINYA